MGILQHEGTAAVGSCVPHACCAKGLGPSGCDRGAVLFGTRPAAVPICGVLLRWYRGRRAPLGSRPCCRTLRAASGSVRARRGLRAFLLRVVRARTCEAWKRASAGTHTPSVCMSSLFMLASRCSLCVSAQVLLSYGGFHLSCGNPPAPPSVCLPLAGFLGLECFSEVWAFSWRKPASSADLGSLKWLPEHWELCADPHQSAWLPFPLSLWLYTEIKPVRDPRADSLGCCRANSSDPSPAGGCSLPSLPLLGLLLCLFKRGSRGQEWKRCGTGSTTTHSMGYGSPCAQLEGCQNGIVWVHSCLVGWDLPSAEVKH